MKCIRKCVPNQMILEIKLCYLTEKLLKCKQQPCKLDSIEWKIERQKKPSSRMKRMKTELQFNSACSCRKYTRKTVSEHDVAHPRISCLCWIFICAMFAIYSCCSNGFSVLCRFLFVSRIGKIWFCRCSFSLAHENGWHCLYARGGVVNKRQPKPIYTVDALLCIIAIGRLPFGDWIPLRQQLLSVSISIPSRHFHHHRPNEPWHTKNVRLNLSVSCVFVQQSKPNQTKPKQYHFECAIM